MCIRDSPNTHAFVGSPELVTAIAISGDLTFNPLADYITNKNGEKIFLDPPRGFELPGDGFTVDNLGYLPPADNGKSLEVKIDPESERLQLLKPFSPLKEMNYHNVSLLIKTKGKCTTDHISMAGPWLKYRGHLDNISNNMLTGPVNFFNGKVNI